MLRNLLETGVVYNNESIYGKFVEFLYSIAKSLDESILLFITLGLIVVITFAVLIAKSRTYEKKLLRNVKSINGFLSKNPYINEENLVTLNSKMKLAPKALRHSWQEYMLNRDKLPSEYMNAETVIDQPSKSSGYRTCIKVCRNLYIVSAIIMAVLIFSRVLANFDAKQMDEIKTYTFVVQSLFDVMLLPSLLLLIGFTILSIFESTYSSFTHDLYYEFREFQGYINKACTTMPPYIDYEILFTQKEIKDGISVLQEYLDKKAIQEQKEKEEAELNKQNYEKFDFDELGVEGSILLERAMTESEKYFNIKRNLVERRTSKEQEIANYSKNFDDVTKDFERKAQTIRESMNQITEQLNNTSVKIEANYLKKRYDEEQQKLQQLEKDHQLSEARFKKQQAELQEELDAISEEIESRKKKLENIMLSEGKSYSNKIYGLINDIVNKQNEPHFKEMEEQKSLMQAEIDNMKQKIASYEIEINNKSTQINELEKDLGMKLAQIETIESVKDYFVSDEFRKRVAGVKGVGEKEFVGYDDAEELRAKLLHAEEQLMLANERNTQLENRTKEIVQEANQQKEKAVAEAREKGKVEAKEELAKEQESKDQDLETVDFDKISQDMLKTDNNTPKPEEKKEVATMPKQPAKPVEDAKKVETNSSAQLKSKMDSLTQKKSSLQSSIDRLKSKAKK